MEFSSHLTDKAAGFLEQCRAQGLKAGTAESCTGGLLAALLTDIPGSSDVVLGGLATYANEVKEKLLGVEHEVLERHGAVSEEVCAQMACGANKALGTDLCAAITGIAGPTGGGSHKPVGLVHIATCLRGELVQATYYFKGTRRQIRMMAVEKALDMMMAAVATMDITS